MESDSAAAMISQLFQATVLVGQTACEAGLQYAVDPDHLMDSRCPSDTVDTTGTETSVPNKTSHDDFDEMSTGLPSPSDHLQDCTECIDCSDDEHVDYGKLDTRNCAMADDLAFHVKWSSYLTTIHWELSRLSVEGHHVDMETITRNELTRILRKRLKRVRGFHIALCNGGRPPPVGPNCHTHAHDVCTVDGKILLMREVGRRRRSLEAALGNRYVVGSYIQRHQAQPRLTWSDLQRVSSILSSH